MAATVRIFLPTYRRPLLLQRAFESIRAQTFADWICEVHNDDPGDSAPSECVVRSRDARFTCHTHPRNLGGTATFNLFFRGTAEPFFAILEDDNTWAPDFLERMLAVARRHPEATVFWCNQSLWEEQSNGEVRNTGSFVHPYRPDETPRRIMWPDRAQVFGAVHAQSAALFRTRGGNDFRTPHVPISLVEAFRERVFPHPLVFVPQPLAGFTITRQTARSRDRAEWALLQTMLVATFVKHAAYQNGNFAELWRQATCQRPPSTNTLLLASLIEPACRELRRQARPADWLGLARSVIRHPATLARVLRSRRVHAEWWHFLDRATAARFDELRRSQ